MFLVSSNRKKLNEIQRFGLDLELRPGLDLPEVSGTPDEVIIHKAIAAGVGAVVEDTILSIDGEPVVDIRWRLHELAERLTLPAEWIVSLGHNDGTHVHLYRGVVTGRLRHPAHPREGAFGFDPYFVPDGQDQSLDELEQQGRKDLFSARRQAVERLMEKAPHASVALADVPAWQGAYQGA